MRITLFFLLTLGLWLAPRAVRAADILEIPEDCGSQTELSREASALHAASPNATQIERPAVRLTRDTAGYVLQVELPEGRRVLRDPDCRALFRAAIVISALGDQSSAEQVLDAAQKSGPAAAEPARVVSRASSSNARTETRSEAPVSQVTKPGKRSLPRVTIAHDLLYPKRLAMRALVRADLSYGLVPELSAVAAAGLSLEYARFATRVLLGYHTPRIAKSGDESVRVDALSAALTLELVALPWLRPGLGAELVALHGRGRGGRSARAAWTSQPLLHASLNLRIVQVKAFWLELGLRALWAPEPRSFVMRGRPALYTVSRWGAQAGIAASFQFL